jgi:dethiobiotin synthetase
MTASTLRGCFVTGTDTEIGKTRISAALLHALAQSGLRSAGLKPVAAGTSLIGGERVNEDVRALRDASAVSLTDAEAGPFQFDAACAPHIAAALEGRQIDRRAILRSARALAARADVLVVEGVGGFRVPLGAQWDTADMARDLGLDVVLVVGLRLGCINHALLTAEAIRAQGLRLAGWIGNHVSRDMPWAGENIATLRDWLGRQHGAACLGVVPWLDDPHPAAVAAHLDRAALRALFY